MRSGQWTDAFRHLRALQQTASENAASNEALIQVSRQVAQAMPLRTADPDVEIEAIRTSAENGDLQTLAEALDHAAVLVPARSFVMGSAAGPANESPVHEVYLDAYRTNRYEVTKAQYRRWV
jgi:formylglycine-generating enzyme required for sulfatase activity